MRTNWYGLFGKTSLRFGFDIVKAYTTPKEDEEKNEDEVKEDDIKEDEEKNEDEVKEVKEDEEKNEDEVMGRKRLKVTRVV